MDALGEQKPIRRQNKQNLNTMKTIHLLILSIFLLNSTINAQSKIDTLTNAKIIQLSKIGLQPSVIINKIKTSVTNFDVSTDALINLSNNGVPSEVINEMMGTVNQKNTAVATKTDSKDPNTMHKSGIYYYNPVDANNPVRKIEVLRVSSYKSSGGGYYGVGGSSETAILSGAQSKQQIIEKNPVFYFYFNENNNVKADWYENAASPNEFVLVKLLTKKEQRLLKVGSSSTAFVATTSSSGVPEKNKLPFDYTQIADGIYKVTFKTPLEPGEYCFLFATETYKVFDFGITGNGSNSNGNTQDSKPNKVY